MSQTSEASYPNGHQTTSPVIPERTRPVIPDKARQDLRHLPETILEWRCKSSRRHALGRHIRAPKTQRWHHCPSRSRLLHRAAAAAVDMVIIVQLPAQQGSAPRSPAAGHQVQVWSPLDLGLRHHRAGGRSPHQQTTRGSDQLLAARAAAFGASEQTVMTSYDRSLRSLTSEPMMRTGQDMILRPHHQADHTYRSQIPIRTPRKNPNRRRWIIATRMKRTSQTEDLAALLLVRAYRNG